MAGQALKAGDAVLVVVGAANRDPSLNPESDLFDIHRLNRRAFSFGHGVHECPGSALATAIACAGIEAVLRFRPDLITGPEPVAYRPSANARISLLPGVTTE